MEYLTELVGFFLHIDKHLAEIVSVYGIYVYPILFAIIFCETGLVVTPFLPGDSLLFAAGAAVASSGVAAATQPADGTALNIHLLAVLLVIAAILGDAANYTIGRIMGTKAFTKFPSVFRRSYLNKTEEFYKRYGGMTIIYARFVPIVRTFAPFLAGVGAMNYPRFLSFNVIGGILWITLFLYGGFFFGSIPIVKNNFSLVILAIILISIVPPLWEIVRAKLSKQRQPAV